MFSRLREDIAAVKKRDPAARSSWQVLTCYPGLHAIVLHRLAHACWGMGWTWLASFIAYFGRWLTLIEIHPGAKLGRRVFIDHGIGVVVGETAEIGDDCTIYQGVTLGGTSLYRGTKRHPTLASGVVVGAGAKVLGGFTVGTGAKIGSNAVVVKEVPPGYTAIGIPARLIDPSGQQADQFAAYGVTQEADPEVQTMNALTELVTRQQRQIQQLWLAVQTLAPDSALGEMPSCDDLQKLLKRVDC